MAFIQQAMEQLIDICPETDDQLWEYIRVMLGIELPRVGVCPGHQSVFEALADMFFMRHADQDPMWVGGRGTGKTMGIAVLERLLCHFFADTIASVGAIEEQAKKCYSYIQRIDQSPVWAKRVRRSILSRTMYTNGGELEIMPATMSRVNSPHPRVALLDEVDLMKQAVMNEAISMPIRTNGRPPQILYTSSLKKRYGPMMALMDGAKERGIRKYTFCIFEAIETCKPERHQEGVGCKTCPLAAECLDQEIQGDGSTKLLPGPGKAARARNGYWNIDDVIRQYRKTPPHIWRSQWRCEKPSAEGLVYPQFDEDIHVIDYEFNPSLPVYGGADFGYVNASVAVYAQILPTDEIVIFAEDYERYRTDVEFANSVKHSPYARSLQWLMGDPAAAGGREEMSRHGINCLAADNRKDLAKDDSGIAKVRWALAPPGRNRPILFVAKRCVNVIREFKGYHTEEKSPTADKNESENAAKVDDHCMDAVRYLIARLIRNDRKSGKAA